MSQTFASKQAFIFIGAFQTISLKSYSVRPVLNICELTRACFIVYQSKASNSITCDGCTVKVTEEK